MTDPLETIRRAYRYIAAYERRILDSVDMVDEGLRELGFERSKPYRWNPLYASFPSRTYAPEHWVWDNLPNYAMRYQWFAGAPNAAGNRWVLLDHIADTAFEQRRLTQAGEPDPLQDLAPVEDAQSILRWHAIEFADALPKKSYALGWSKLLRAQLGITMVSAPTPHPVVHRGHPLECTLHCVDISALTDSSSLQELLVAPLLHVLAGSSTA